MKIASRVLFGLVRGEAKNDDPRRSFDCRGLFICISPIVEYSILRIEIFQLKGFEPHALLNEYDLDTERELNSFTDDESKLNVISVWQKTKMEYN